MPPKKKKKSVVKIIDVKEIIILRIIRIPWELLHFQRLSHLKILYNRTILN